MSPRKTPDGTTFWVRQVRSGIGFSARQKATLRALGLEKLGRVRELPDNPQVRGMVAKVSHLVVVSGREPNRSEGRG